MGNKLMNVFTYPTLTNLPSIIKKSKGYIPFQATKPYRWYSSSHFNFDARRRWVVNVMPQPLYPRKRTPVPIGRPPELVRIILRRKNLLPLPEFKLFTAQRMAQSLCQLSS